MFVLKEGETMTEGQALPERQELGAIREQIFSLFLKLVHQIETHDEEQQVLAQQLAATVSSDIWSGMTVTMIHVLDVIGQREPVNGITIARQLAITKGGVAKIARKLGEKHLVIREEHPTNKKEIYFRLTDQGKEIFALHRRLHQDLEEQSLRFLSKYSQEELHIIVRFLQDLIASSAQ